MSCAKAAVAACPQAITLIENEVLKLPPCVQQTNSISGGPRPQAAKMFNKTQ